MNWLSLAMLLLCADLIAQYIYKPYTDEAQNYIEALSTATLLGVAALAAGVKSPVLLLVSISLLVCIFAPEPWLRQPHFQPNAFLALHTNPNEPGQCYA